MNLLNGPVLYTRYPNSFESGNPYEYFTKKEAGD